jgi:hypothetical protein
MNRNQRRLRDKLFNYHKSKCKTKMVPVSELLKMRCLKTPNPMFDSQLYLESIMNKNFDFSVDETCSLCSAKITDFRDSHNPYPLAINSKDRCCSVCNNTVVLDARLSQIEDYEDELVN